MSGTSPEQITKTEFNLLYTMNLRNFPGILLVRLPLAVAFGVAAIVALAASLLVLLLDPVIHLFFGPENSFNEPYNQNDI